MPAKKTEKRKRDRLLIEMPLGGREIWFEARSIALRKRLTIGEFVIFAIREQIGREGEKGKK